MNATTSFDDGSVMVLYCDATGPVDHSIRLTLAEKDIGAKVVYVDDDLPEELAGLNPYNALPLLVERDLVLYDAQALMEYLDERFPHPPLMPAHPVARAQNRQLRGRLQRDLYELSEVLEKDGAEATSQAGKELLDNLTAIAPAFERLPYFMSEEFTLMDCLLAPLLWRLEKYQLELPPAAAPLRRYALNLFKRRGFRLSLSAPECKMRRFG